MTEEKDLDTRLEALLDEAELSRRRANAEQRFRDVDSMALKTMRKMAKNDLFWLATAVLDYELLSPRLHGHFCRWKERTRKSRYRLILKPRGHYKTTVDTIAESVQIALPNDDGIVEEYPWTLGPNVKIFLAHETEKGASRALVEIAEAFMAKEMMLALFPECVPSSKTQRINKLELELPRTAHHKEPTFDALGGGAAQGRHYHRLKLDDLVGEKARESSTIMLGILDWFDNCGSLLTRPKFDGWDLTGTRWSLVDVYSHAMEKYGIDRSNSFLRAIDQNRERIPEGSMAAYIRGAIEDGEPIFPEEFDMEFFKPLMKNRKVWSAQYANNPLDSGLTEFDVNWLKSYNVTPNGDLIVFEGSETPDGRRGSRRIRVRDLDRVVLFDPSMGENDDSDETGIVVTGTDHRHNIYILETIKKRLLPPQLIDMMFHLWTKWNPRVMAVEKVNFSGIYKYWFLREANRVGITPFVYDYSPGSARTKAARVRGLATFGAAGQIYCMENDFEFREEWERFGVSKNYHLLDALAQGPEVWKEGLRDDDIDRFQREEEKIIQLRSAQTGY